MFLVLLFNLNRTLILNLKCINHSGYSYHQILFGGLILFIINLVCFAYLKEIIYFISI